MAEVEASITDVRIALSDAQQFLDRFALEFEALPDYQRTQLTSLALGVKKLQLGASRLVDVAASLEARLTALERRGE